MAPVHLPRGEGVSGIIMGTGGEGMDAVEFELSKENSERHSDDDGEMEGGSGGGAE